MLYAIRPARSSFLWLYFTLSMPMKRAKTTATVDESVCICPTTATGRLKAFPMSTNKIPRMAIGEAMAKRDSIRDITTNLPGEDSDSVGKLFDNVVHLSSLIVCFSIYSYFKLT